MNSEHLRSKVVSIKELVNSPEIFPEAKILDLVNAIRLALNNGAKLAFLGNGGSAAESIHLAAEFTGKCVNDHRPLRAICLNESQSSLTAIMNDYGANFVFSRIVEAYIDAEDILIVLSTSGKSPNILEAVNSALKIGARVIMWTGNSNISEIENVEYWRVPSTETPRIQEIHLMWGHIIAELVEIHF